MTLIVTQFSHYGIVLAADSNISRGSYVWTVRRKLFRVPALSAGVAFAGGQGVGARGIVPWMRDFIGVEQTRCGDLLSFCGRLAEGLNAERTEAQKKTPVIAHVAGFVAGVPMMWHLSNVELLLDHGGRYTWAEPEITVKGPDFEQANWDAIGSQPAEQMPLQYFVNGALEGRIAFNTYQHFVTDWLRSLWQPGLPFRAPTCIDEQEDLTRTSMEVMRLMFRMSPMAAIIGGTIQSLAISSTTVGEIRLVTEAVPDHLGRDTGRPSVDSEIEL
jgi:hypothetical protein